MGVKRLSPRVWEVDSHHTDEKYTIWLGLDGRFLCTCLGYQIHRDSCSHIKEVEQELIKEKRGV